MPDTIRREDLRIKKTYKSLIDALIVLLQRKNFNQITVNNLCSEALISRATFYVRFNDKYDLLKSWLSDLNSHLIKNIYNYEELELNINQFIFTNKKVIANVLIDANKETLDLVHDFISTIIGEIISKYDNSSNKNAGILLDFCTGGIVNMIMLQVKNHFPEDNNMMTRFLFDLMKQIMVWVHSRKDY